VEHAILTPTTRPRSLRPGQDAPGPGLERHRVAGGGCVVVPIAGGDRVRVVDPEGGQSCELVAFGPSGACEPGLLGRASTGPAAGLFAILDSDGPDGLFTRRLQRHGLAVRGAEAVAVLDADGPAGSEETLTVEGAGVLAVAAPGGAMTPDQQTPPTDLVLFIERADPAAAAAGRLPDPLADPRVETRIGAGTAQAYEVKAGEWIQIIDVAGRQCSDFQAFSAPRLQAGMERPLDATTTRTLMGAGYPLPGTHAKSYDQDMRPLVEVMQDTCTRHDAFGLACTAKYYDDMGYPGHVNCSDNFNAALNPFGVAPRMGWMAMNFFYNTAIDDHNAFVLDEPWSRPGDYVMLRALDDLVCVSSACPDDTGAANAWNPTDIHVRVYKPDLDVRRSIGFRKRPDAEVEMTKETGFHPRTQALTRDFVEYQGFWLPNSFVQHGAAAEYWACREKAVMLDLSALRKFEVLGPDAETLLQRCLTRNVRKLAVGDVVYSAMCYDTGTMIDDGTAFRMTDTNFRWIGGSDFGGEWLRQKAAEWGLEVRVKSSTDQLHNVSVQGPLSRDILRDIVWTQPTQPSVDELGWFKFAVARIGDYDGIPIVLSRTGYTGELGYEIFCHPKDAAAVWDAVMEAGAPRGLLPMGLAALDMLRIEAGLIFAGSEFDDQTDPFEAGIGFTVPLKSKQEDFVGRDALQKRKDNPQRKLVGLELVGNDPAAHGDCVHVGRHQVGVVTSAVRSPILAKNIALCRMAVEYAEPGTEVEVGKLDGHAKRLPAVVTAFPAFDPKKERPRS
jgi:aminomethyltransferase